MKEKILNQLNVMSIFWAMWGTMLILLAYLTDLSQEAPVAAELCKMGGVVCWTKVRSGSEPKKPDAPTQ